MRSKDPELMKSICSYIDHFYRENHFAPTQREVANAMNIAPSSAHRYLTAMGKNGMISYDGKVIGTPQTDKCSSEYISAPIVGSIRCGDPELEVEQVEEYVSLPSSIFGKGDFYILRAKGTSMIDAGIVPGDLIVIEMQNTAEVGDIVVALDDEKQNTLKRYGGVDRETGKAVLRYENEEEFPGRQILVKELVVQGVARHIIRAISAKKGVSYSEAV
ncbi:MAG: repressor LexA [Lachnospiraceae bacterium]|nr:repressor LexA [Lachnospiraceae bacterium]